MIYTLTLNPAIDYYLEFDGEIKNYQIATQFSLLGGGKGVNASILLSNLGIKNKAIMPLGGNVGVVLKDILEKQIDIIKIPIDAETRINVKTHFTNQNYEMNVRGTKVDPNKLLLNTVRTLKETLQKGDLLMIMGSLPFGMDISNLDLIAKEVLKMGVKLVFDLPQGNLIHILKHKPEIVKPNIFELRNIFNFEIKTKEEIKRAANEILLLGAKRVIVSNGKHTSYYMDSKNFIEMKAIKIDEINASGAGDSMLAGFVGKLEEGKSLDECLRFAIASGTGTASSVGIAEKTVIESYISKTELIKEISHN